MSEARPTDTGSLPPDDAHLPDPSDEVSVAPAPPSWVPERPAGETARMPTAEDDGRYGPPGSAPGRDHRDTGRSAPPSTAPPGSSSPSPPGSASAKPVAPGAASDAPAALAAPGMDDRERPLAPKVVTAWRIGSVTSMIFPTLALSVPSFIFLDRWGWAVLGGLLGLLLLMVVWYAPARYARWRWQLTDLAVELRYGVIVRRQETVPYFRIQQIDIVQGPLDRILDLATLQVTTASASGSAALPGIANDDAPRVRAELLARAAAAVADHPGDLRDAV